MTPLSEDPCGTPPSGSTPFPRPLGSNWTKEPRPCDDCGKKHTALILWTDKKMRCVGCGRTITKAGRAR